MSLVKEFKEFAVKGNAVDMAVGIIIGGAFGKIVSSLVNDVIMPPIGRLAGQRRFYRIILQSWSDILLNTGCSKRSRCAHLKLRQLHSDGDRLCDHCLRHLHDDQGHQCHEKERGGETCRTAQTK